MYTLRLEPTELEALELERTASVARYILQLGARVSCQVKLRRAQRHLSRARQGSRIVRRQLFFPACRARRQHGRDV